MAEGESIMALLHPGEPAVHTALVFIFLFSPPSERKAAKDWGGERRRSSAVLVKGRSRSHVPHTE